MKLHTWFINIQGEIEMPYSQKPHIGNFELSFVQSEPEIQMRFDLCRFKL